MEGKRLKELRRQRGLTLDTLSERSGISKSYLSLIERDIQSNPSLDILHRIARTFELGVEDLVKSDKEYYPVELDPPRSPVKTTFRIELEFTLEEMNPQKLEQIKELIAKLKQE